MMKIDFSRAVEILNDNDNFIILTHANPDGDTLGGGFALLSALRKLGKRAKLVNNDPIPEKPGFHALFSVGSRALQTMPSRRAAGKHRSSCTKSADCAAHSERIPRAHSRSSRCSALFPL